jgi:choline monooxygenase
MSDLATISKLTKVSPQLPMSWYFDPRLDALERTLLFDNGPGYVGHELMVPNQGDYFSLGWMNHAKVLVRNAGAVELLSNVCRHRQSVMLKGRGNVENIVCPLHRWTYDLEGKLLGAPHFPTNPCLNLGRTALQSWNGALFAGRRDVASDLSKLGVANELSFDGYMLDNVVIEEYDFNWKTFVEVYLEDYHVVPFHPGLGNFVDSSDLEWEFGNWYSVQVVGVNKGLSKAGTPAYGKWHEVVLNYNRGELPPHGAIWVTYYPNIMLEWYPHVLVISTVWPRGPEKCVNVVEYYYAEDIALFEREFIEAEQKAYAETAAEDEAICTRMTEGRRALYEQGLEQAGPYQSPMEDGMLHFHEFLRRKLEPHLRS